MSYFYDINNICMKRIIKALQESKSDFLYILFGGVPLVIIIVLIKHYSK